MMVKIVQFQVVDGPHTTDLWVLDSDGHIWRRDMLNPDARWREIADGRPFQRSEDL